MLKQIEALIKDTPAAWTIADLSILRGLMSLLEGELAYFQNQMEQSVTYVQVALTLLPEAWTFARGGCLLFMGLSMQALGQGQVANQLLWTQYETLREKSNGYATRILFALCLNHIQAGQLEQAWQMGELMLEQARRGQLPVLQGWAHYWLGLIAYSWDDLALAAQHFRAIIDLRFVIQGRTARNGLMGLTLVQLAQGAVPEAHTTLELLSQFELDTLGVETDETRSLRVRIQLQRGEVLPALRWAEAFMAPLRDEPLIWQNNAHIVKARLLLGRGTAADIQLAARCIAALLAISERTHNTRFTILLTAVQALVLDAQGQKIEAQAMLQQAIDLARPGRFIRVFVDQGPPMQILLNRLAERHPSDDFIARILTAYPRPNPPRSTSVPATPAPLVEPLAEPLTARELDVLRLMRERLSDKEIASQLNIAPDTVRRHAANLYAKLGVSKRWDAVVKAEALRLLPPR